MLRRQLSCTLANPHSYAISNSHYCAPLCTLKRSCALSLMPSHAISCTLANSQSCALSQLSLSCTLANSISCTLANSHTHALSCTLMHSHSCALPPSLPATLWDGERLEGGGGGVGRRPGQGGGVVVPEDVQLPGVPVR